MGEKGHIMKCLVMGLVFLMLPLIGFSKPLKVVANGVISKSLMPYIINGFQQTYGVFTIFEKKNSVNSVINSINKDKKIVLV